MLYADENFPLPVVERLRKLGHDVLTVKEEGLAGRRTGDTVVLQRAIATNRAVLTQDRYDFRKLHKATSAHRGIIICTNDADPEALTQRIDDAIRVALEANASLENICVVVTRPSR